MRETDGRAGVDYRVRLIKLPDGTHITGDRLADLSRSEKGRAQLCKTVAEVCIPSRSAWLSLRCVYPLDLPGCR